MRRRELSEHDRAVWASYAQTLTALPGVAMPPPPAMVPQPAAAPPPRAAGAALAAHGIQPMRQAPALVVGSSPGGVDAGTWKRFQSGKLAATRTLDLHGRTAQLAHAALNHFLMSAASQGLRCVEVITGRGSGETGGVIRREFPMWLNQPSLRMLILAAAHPHALNPGSVRLLLRRSRR